MFQRRCPKNSLESKEEGVSHPEQESFSVLFKFCLKKKRFATKTIKTKRSKPSSLHCGAGSVRLADIRFQITINK